MSSEKQSVALVSMIASAGLTLAKLLAGLATGSLGILSEAIHSFIDFCATVITYFAVRWGDQPPDAEHHYGHAKVESVAALVETALLFLTTIWIFYEAIHRLVTGETHIEIAWWAAAVIVASVIVDYFRQRALHRVAKATSSEALAADALHFSSDMWSSLAVLVGLGGVWMGFPAADAIAALVVAVFVALIGIRLGRRTLDTLLDAAPGGASERIRTIAESTDGVIGVRRLRIRPAGATLFVGALVMVPRTLPVDVMGEMREKLAARIRAEFPNADVTVTAEPVALDDETISQRVMLIAAGQRLAIHHLTVQDVGGKRAVSFDIEVDGQLSLEAAHAKATGLERAISRELGNDVEVESHIEPLPDSILTGKEISEGERKNLEVDLRRLASTHDRIHDIHNIRVRRNSEGLFVHYHCRFAPDETVDMVHDVIDRIETALQQRHKEIRRVIAHAEPLGHAPH
jgi:cation diffusion facilitator family transporter